MSLVAAAGGGISLIKSGAVKKIFDAAGGFIQSIFGLSRKQKRNRRDDAFRYLRQRGLDPSIYLDNSDNFKLVQGLVNLHKEFGDVVIQALNDQLSPNGQISPANIDQLVGEIEQAVQLQQSAPSAKGTPLASVTGVPPGAQPVDVGPQDVRGLNWPLIGIVGAAIFGILFIARGKL